MFKISCSKCQKTLYEGKIPVDLTTLITNELNGVCSCGHKLNLSSAKWFLNGEPVNEETATTTNKQKPETEKKKELWWRGELKK